MNILLKKGSAFNADYSSLDFPVLTADWSGGVSLYLAYPGTATITKPLTLSGNVLQLVLTGEEILNLTSGVYTVVATMTNTVLGVAISSVSYATVTDIIISDQPMTLLTMTIGKIDGTPSGTAIQKLTNTVYGTVLVSGWKGVKVTAITPDAYNTGTEIIGTEAVSTETNAVGYAQLAVIKGSTVTVTCPSFGKSVTVDTTGLDTIDLSTYF